MIVHLLFADLSHFEVLIQKLQEQEQADRENAEQSGDDNLIGSTFEEDEGSDGDAHETHVRVLIPQLSWIVLNWV